MDIMLVHCVFFSLNELDLFIQVVELMLQIFNHILYILHVCVSVIQLICIFTLLNF